jgi:selenocysteine-specific elongation factor
VKETEQIVIGLAGHIDHGKTALVKALTGIDTDTQAEEKRRGMTIDIGFAFLTDSITLVDVPGHDRFVKNMVRGVAGIHIGLLIIAADDGVMNQTREHFHILRFLGLPRLCIALNKVDLVEEEFLELVEDDIRQLIEGSSYENCPIIRTSAETSVGIEKLREVLLREAESVEPWEDRDFFRLPIDRVFSLKGFGTVATGTVVAGSLKPGDPIELLPGRQEVKLRGFQSHGHNVSEIRMGHRAALNISNLSSRELARGEQIASPGCIATPRSLAVNLELLQDANPLPFNHPVRVNVGTAEVIARAKFVEGTKLQPGRKSPAVLELQDEVPVVIGDKFILRSFSPITTIGGGTIIDVELPERWRDKKAWTRALFQKSFSDQIHMIVESHGANPITQTELSQRLGRSEISTRALLPDTIRQLAQSANTWLVTIDQAATVSQAILVLVQAYHQTHPYKQGANREYIRQKIGGNERFLEVWLKEMVANDLLVARGETWSLPDFSVVLTQSDQDTLDRLINIVETQGFETEYIEDLAERLGTAMEDLKTLIGFAEAQGNITRLTPRIIIHKRAMDHFLENVRQHFLEKQELTIADVKDMTGTTRKYTMPLMEFLDKNGLTVRVGDKRVQPGE